MRSDRPRMRLILPAHPAGVPGQPPTATPHAAAGRGVARLGGVTAASPKDDLQRYLQAAREALLWKLEGLSEYDARRPLVPSGTNLLGLVKHVAAVEAG